MRALLALPEPPTAVFAAADMMAVGAIKAVAGRRPSRARTTSPSSASTTSSSRSSSARR